MGPPAVGQALRLGPSYRSPRNHVGPWNASTTVPSAPRPNAQQEPVQRGMGHQERIADLLGQRVALQPDGERHRA